MATAPSRSGPSSGLLKRVLVGRALATHKQEHQLLPKLLALPVFSSDPLSSVAYATEEMMLVLAAAGAAALSLMIPISFAIALLLVIVVSSYRQTVLAYPQGGGSYIVSRENLGTIPGLIAAAAILTDYVLTVAVSVTAGTIAVTSAAPSLAEHRVLLAVSLVALVTLANLRGVKEAGKLFAVPTYGFVLTVYLTLITGLVECASRCPVASTSQLDLPVEHALTAFVVLRAFASGATALTGVEAIADGVQAFRRPQARNAATTLAVMASISITMFLGITFLARALNVRISEDIHGVKSVLAQIGETVFHGGPIFYVLQAFTAGILILAANTAYQDFPRLSAILARDRFMPAQFRNRGDRLVFSNGVLVLATMASLLIWLFDANLTRLIQLYVVGVFTAFTLSQAGMVRRWRRLRTEGWRHRAAINGIGAITTGIVLVIVTITKFARGAWIVILAMPIIVAFFLVVHRHYERVGRLLRSQGLAADVEAHNTFVLLIEYMDAATMDAVFYLRAFRPERLIPLFVGDDARFDEVRDAWQTAAPRMGQLQPLPGAERGEVRSLRRYLRSMRRERNDFVTVVIPETLRSDGWRQFLVDRRALVLKAALFFEPNIVVMDVPLLPEERPVVERRAQRRLEPLRSVAIIPVAAVHDATVRAAVYARSLNPASIEAVYLATDPDDVPTFIDQWANRRIPVPVSVVEVPFRDLGPPLLNEVRKHTRWGETVVTVVLPEFVVDKWWENILHNQTGFYIKRLLLFEPGVVVASVPFHLGAMDGKE